MTFENAIHQALAEAADPVSAEFVRARVEALTGNTVRLATVVNRMTAMSKMDGGATVVCDNAPSHRLYWLREAQPAR